jgi:tetratricopeptide (TPR) repeat protein
MAKRGRIKPMLLSGAASRRVSRSVVARDLAIHGDDLPLGPATSDSGLITGLQRVIIVTLASIAAIMLPLPDSALASWANVNPCALGDVFREIHLLSQANEAYSVALKVDSTLLCARSGIEMVARARGEAQTHLALGRAYEAENRTADAEAEYLASAQLDASNEDAVGALSALLGEKPAETDPFAVAVALAEAGFDKAAADEVQKVLKASPGAAVPGRLRYLAGTPIGKWQRFRHVIDPFAQTAVQAVIALAVLLLAWAFVRKLVRARRKRLLIQPFDVAVEGLPIGTSMAWLIQENLTRLSGNQEDTRLGLISSPPEEIDIPSQVSDLSPTIKVLSAVLRFLVQPKMYTLSGSLHAAAGHGAGMTLLLRTPSGDLAHSVTIWQRTYDPRTNPKAPESVKEQPATPSPYYRLAPVAASWVLFKWRSEVRGNDSSILGTRSWESFALFQSGVDWQLYRDVERARDLYLESLAKDPGNQGALLNLGGLDGEAGDYVRAIERIEILLGSLNTGAMQ